MDHESDVKRVPVGTLELREERATVERQRVAAGQVVIRRERRTRVQTIEVDLTDEVLVIETSAGQGQVFLGGRLLEPGTVQEVLLSQEQVQVVKQVYAVQDVYIAKETRTVQHTVPVELAYEEIVVEQQDVDGHLVVLDSPEDHRET